MVTWKQASEDYEKKGAGSKSAGTTPPTSGMLSWDKAVSIYDKLSEEDYRTLGQKRSSRRQQEEMWRTERNSVNDWIYRYNRIMEGVSAYDKERNGGFTRDASGGYSGRIESLIADFEGIKGFAEQYGFQDSQKYLDQLKQLQESIGQINDSFSQFEDDGEYDRYKAYMEDLEEKRNVDLDAYSRGIAQLEQQLEAYDPQIDWTDTNQRKQYDKGIQELEDEINRRKQYLTQAQRIQKQDADSKRFADIRNRDDFAENSGFDTGNQEIGYRYVNSDAAGRLDLEQQYGDPVRQFGNRAWDSLNENEKQVYNYLMNTGDRQGAADYLRHLEESLQYRKGQEADAAMDALVAEDPKAKALRYAFMANAGYDQHLSGMRGMGNMIAGNEDYVPASSTQVASGLVREDLAEDGMQLPEWLGGGTTGQMVGDLISTTANMAPSMAVGLISPNAGAALMGASAAGSAYQEKLNEGYSKEQARKYGIAVGASETALGAALSGIKTLGGAVTNKVIGNALKGVKSGIGRFLIEFGGSVASEALEEGIQEILTPVFSNYFLNTDEKVNWSEVAYSALLGGLSAGVLEGPTAVSAARNGANSSDNVTSIFDNVSDFPNNGTKAPDNGTKPATGASKMETVQQTGDIDSFARQFGTQAEAVKRNYLEGQDLQEYEVGFQTAYAMGLEGGKQEALTKVPYLSQSQREIAFSMGRDAAAAQKAAAEKTAAPEKKALTAKLVNGDGTQDVTIAEVVDMNETAMTFRLEDGRTVTDEDLHFDHGQQMLSAAWELGMDAKTVNSILQESSDSAATDADLAAGIQEAHHYGQHGYTMEQLTKHGADAAVLTDGQRKAAWEAGRKLHLQKAEATPGGGMKVSGKTAGVWFDAGGGDIRAFDSADLSGLSEAAVAGARAAQVLQKLGIGRNYYFYESYVNQKGERVYKDEKGQERKAPNGWYDPDGSIHIDLNAGADGKGMTMYTLSHELTHYVEKWSPKKYQALADFLVSNYAKAGNVDAMVAEKQAQLSESRGSAVSYEEAYSEFIADSMEAMLADGNVLEKLQELKKTDKSLFDKIREFFGNLAKKIREIYKDLTPDTLEGQAVLQMKDQIDQIQQLFAEAMVEAGENFQAAAEIGLEVDMDTESVSPAVMYSERTWKESEYVQERSKAAKEIAKAKQDHPGRQFSDRKTANRTGEKAPTFYSYMGTVVAGMKQEKFGAASVVNMLRGKGVKAEEIKWSGIEAWLEGKKSVTKTELQEFIAGSMLQIEEETHSGGAGISLEPAGYTLDGESNNVNVMRGGEVIDFLEWDDFNEHYVSDALGYSFSNEDEIIRYYSDGEDNGDARWGEYKLDGGENYREILFRLPDATYTNSAMQNHWGSGAEGILAHARMQDFDTEDGKMLFIEEIQSDWHNEGHKRGYRSEDALKKAEAAKEAYRKLRQKLRNDKDTLIKDLVAFYRTKGYDTPDKAAENDLQWHPSMMDTYRYLYQKANMPSELVSRVEEFQANMDKQRDLGREEFFLKNQYKEGIPDAPFRDNYHEFVLKRLIREAAEKGYDSIGWTTADIQSERWSDDYAEGYRIEYDQEIPKFLRKYGKKWGATVGKADIQTKQLTLDQEADLLMMADIIEDGDEYVRRGRGIKEVWSMPITNSMRDSVLHDGQVLYQDRSKGTSNRALLAGAFEGLTQNSNEYSFIQEYRENVALLNEQEQKLQEIRTEIRELTFGKGPKDPKRLEQLQEEAGKTANRIHIYDKRLLGLEAAAPIQQVLAREKEKVRKASDLKHRDAMKKYREETRAALEGKTSETEIMEREFLRLMRAYEKLSTDSAEKAKKAKKTIDKKQDVIDSYKADLTTMEREFLRVMKGYETAERKTNAFWEGEFKRLMREYEASDRKVDRLEAKLKAQRESFKSNVDGRKRTVLRNKIRKDIRELDKILNRGNKKRNVKQGMQDFVAKAIATGEILFADLDSDTDLIASGIQADMNEDERKLLTEAERYVRQIAELEGNDAMADVLAARQRGLNEVLKRLKPVLERERIRINSSEASGAFDALVSAYESLQVSQDTYIAAAFKPEALEYLMSVKHKFAGTLVKDMSQEQLQTLHKCYKMVMTMIRDANKAFVDGRSVQADAEQMVQEFQQRKIPSKKMGIILRNLSNTVGWNYEKLYYALERINSPTLKRLYQNLADSENITMQDVQEAKAFQMEMVEKYHYNDWKIDQEMEQTFLDNNGKEFHLTLGELMALYAYSRREGADRHIEVGGFTFGKNALTNPEPASTYKLTADQVAAISDLLTPEQKTFAEAMQRYLSKTMGSKGNEVSLKLYGIEMFGEENYFPLHIAGEYKARAQESQAKAEAGFQSMTNAGFTKARNANATAPIVLEDFMTVWVDHVNEMSRYHGAVPALEDIRRVMNYSVYSDAMADSVSVQAAMTNAYGKQAVQYFDSLYREANSGAVTDKMDATSKKMLSAFRKNSVAYSASVVIQQPASIYRAKAIVDSKYFGKHGLFTLTGGVLRIFNRKKWNSAYADMMQYAPGVTMAKEIGGFDTSSGGSIRSYLLDTDRGFKQSMKNGTAAQKAGALLNVVDDNVIANLPNVADKIAWIEIWEACRRETVANNPKLATSSEEFKQKVGQRFTEVIRATQVYDSMFSKSPMLKSKNLAVQYVVSFMNEPNTVANMAEKALRDVLQGNVKTAGKAIGALATSIVVTNLLKSIIYAMRDEDDDETFMEKYLSAVAGNLTSDVNPLNYIPYARDVWSIWQGYDVERADMAVIADAVNAIRKLQKLNEEDVAKMSEEELEDWDKKVMDAQWRVAETLSPIAGIPLKNVRREVLSVINAVTIRELDKNRTSTKLSIRHAVEEATGLANRSDREKLYDAIQAGDAAYVQRLKAGYKTEDAYHNAIRQALRDNESRIWEAANAWNSGDMDTYLRIAKEIRGENRFEQDDIVLAIRAEANSMLESNSESASTVKGYFTNETFGVALSQNNTSMADIIRKDLIDTKVANGKTREEAARSVESAARSQLKELFEDGSITGAAAEKLLVRYGGYDQEEAADKVADWKFESEYGFSYSERGDAYKNGEISQAELRSILMDVGGKTGEEADLQIQVYDWETQGFEGATISAVRNYNEYCAGARVPKDVYLHIRKVANSTDNDVDASGKTIYYSAMKKIMAEIGGQYSLTATQKYAIARSLGWSDKNIEKYKTW